MQFEKFAPAVLDLPQKKTTTYHIIMIIKKYGEKHCAIYCRCSLVSCLLPAHGDLLQPVLSVAGASMEICVCDDGGAI